MSRCAGERPAPVPSSLVERASTSALPAAETVTFSEYSPLARAEEVARRTLSPLVYAHGQEALRARGRALTEQIIDLSREEFSLWVPPGPPPPKGYGLLVFIAP
ncbi:MAG TPA: hypothetical protein VFG59_08070, partial [Anaeromyxobacter sp.]|nr:hypothetical protein [Anaeromyxobacter sp.]